MTATSVTEAVVPAPVSMFGSSAVAGPGLDRTGRFRRSRGLLIDLDNTLYPMGRFVQSGFTAVAAHVGQTWGVPSDTAYALLSRCHARGEQRTAFQSLCQRFNLSDETVPVLVDVFRSHQPTIFLGHGARNLLQDLRADGWRLAVLTNGLPAVQARKVEALGLGSLVDHVFYAEHFAPGGKPAPGVFTEALRRLGTVPARTVCVGDDADCDIAGARRAGLATVRLAISDAVVAPECEADIVVNTLADVARAAASLLEGVARHAA